MVQAPYQPLDLSHYRLTPMSRHSLLYNHSLRKHSLPVEIKTLPGNPAEKTCGGNSPIVLSSVCVEFSWVWLGHVVSLCCGTLSCPSPSGAFSSYPCVFAPGGITLERIQQRTLGVSPPPAVMRGRDVFERRWWYASALRCVPPSLRSWLSQRVPVLDDHLKTSCSRPSPQQSRTCLSHYRGFADPRMTAFLPIPHFAISTHVYVAHDRGTTVCPNQGVSEGQREGGGCLCGPRLLAHLLNFGEFHAVNVPFLVVVQHVVEYCHLVRHVPCPSRVAGPQRARTGSPTEAELRAQWRP